MSYENAKSKYQTALSSFSMLKGLKSVLVGFSGGADSTLLLTLLAKESGIRVAAAHLNHGIRGEEALRDENFCIDYCKKLGIDIYVKHSDIPDIAKTHGLTVEEAARNERYKFFNEILNKQGYDCIATAHNADDNAETMIFNLVRGASLSGLCGIPPKRDNIIRPLILLTKDEILEACESEHIQYVKDSTNNDTEYTRNYIRHEIIPRLKNINPSVCDTILSANASLRNTKEYLHDISRRHSFSEGRSSLTTLHDAVLSIVISNELTKHSIRYGSKHIDDIIKAIRSSSAHVKISLPSCTLICDRDTVYLDSGKKSLDVYFPLRPGSNELPDGRLIYLGYNEKDINTLKNIYKLSIQVTVCSAKISSDSFVRYRRFGDTYKINGMTKKVKKLIQSLKLPSNYTDRIPFICSDTDVLYIPHFQPSDHLKPECNSDPKTDIFYFYDKEQ